MYKPEKTITFGSKPKCILSDINYDSKKKEKFWEKTKGFISKAGDYLERKGEEHKIKKKEKRKRKLEELKDEIEIQKAKTTIAKQREIRMKSIQMPSMFGTPFGDMGVKKKKKKQKSLSEAMNLGVKKKKGGVIINI